MNAVIFVVVLLFNLNPSYAATLNVCADSCDHTTIQAAITAAGSGDTISVAAGTYTETLSISKNLTINGAGAATTIIDANAADYNITVSGGASVTISNLKIIDPDTAKAGIFINQSTVTLQNCIIDNSEGTLNKGIAIDPAGGSNLTIKNTLIEGYSSRGIYAQGSNVRLA